MAYSPNSADPPPYRPRDDEYELRRQNITPAAATNVYSRRSDGPAAPPEVDFYPEKRNLAQDLSTPAERSVLLANENSKIRLVQSADTDNEIPGKMVAGDAVIDHKAPPDRYHFVYLILLIHGMGVLLPWNAFINAFEYFTDYKLAAHNVTSISENGSVTVYDENLGMRSTWSDTMTVVAQLPNLILNGLNFFINIRGTLVQRMFFSLAVLILVLLETLVFAAIDTSTWTRTFYGITLASVFLVNAAGGIYQNSTFGLAASMSSQKYINAVIIGNNICGTFMSLLVILAIALFPNKGHQAVCYFLVALLFLIFTFTTYFMLPKSRFYRYNILDRTASSSSQQKTSLKDNLNKLWFVFKQIYIQCWNVFFVFFVTLACFPSITANIKPIGDGPFEPAYYLGIGCFLFFNLFAFVGNLIPFAIVKPGPKWVWIPILLRVLFIPYFMLCNYRPEGVTRSAPVHIPSDWAYHVGVVLLGLTSGYFSSLAMMFAPGQVKDSRFAPVAGQIAAFFLVLGIFVGLLFPRIAIFFI